jgi:lactate permease
VGVPIITLANVTGMPIHDLALATSLQLLPLTIILPCVLVCMVGGGIKGAGGTLKHAFFCGLAFGVTQTVVAVFVGAELAAIAASLVSLLTILVCCRLFSVKKLTLAVSGAVDAAQTVEAPESDISASPITASQSVRAAGSYIIMLALVLVTTLLPQLHFLKQGAFLFTHRFYSGDSGSLQSFALLTNPGTLFLIAGLVGAALYGMKLSVILKTLWETVKQIKFTSLTIIFVLCIARMMYHAGMVSSIAMLLAATGVIFPAISPLLGAFGTFITGSDTSSNVLFGSLQKQTAIQTGSNVTWVVAGNASGATVGKMLSLQSISIASASIKLKGAESQILKRTIKYAGIMALVLALIVFLGNWVY